MPDRIALGLPERGPGRADPGALPLRRPRDAARHPALRGLPGIHVSARNPSEAEAAPRGPDGLPLETTVVETHTSTRRSSSRASRTTSSKAGLRVFSAHPPIFTVRRQWERSSGSAGRTRRGRKECYCHFQIERVDSKERLRRIEHEIYSVLKCVFLAVEDFDGDGAGRPRAAAAAAGRRGEAGERRSRRAPSSTGSSTTTTSSWARPRYRRGPDGRPTAIARDAPPASSRTRPAARGLPRAHRGGREPPPPGPGRRPDRRPRLLQQRRGHLPPRADRRHRGPRVGRGRAALRAATLLLGRFAKGAFAAEGRPDIPLLGRSYDWLLGEQRRRCRTRTPTARSGRVFNRFPKRELFYADVAALKAIIDRIVYMTGDDEIAVHSRKGTGLRGALIAFSRLRYSYRIEENLRQALADAFGPISFGTSADCGAVTLLPLLLRLRHGSSTRSSAEAVRRITASAGHHLGGPRGAGPRAAVRRARGAALFGRYVRPETRSGLYREATPPEEVPEDVRHLESLEGRLEVASSRGPRRRSRSTSTRCTPSASPRPCGRSRTRAHRHRGAADPAGAPGGPEGLPLPLRARGAAPTASRALQRARSASSTRCGPSTRSGPPTTP